MPTIELSSRQNNSGADSVKIVHWVDFDARYPMMSCCSINTIWRITSRAWRLILKWWRIIEWRMSD